jgi:hypothetical protein
MRLPCHESAEGPRILAPPSVFPRVLVAASGQLTDAARQLTQETAAFAEANRSGKPDADAWDTLLAGLREASAASAVKPRPEL